jgi:hypothetical protein
MTKTVVYRKQNNVHALNWPICSAYLLPNGVDRRAHKLKDHNNMVGLEKTERAIKNRKTTDSQHWAQDAKRRDKKENYDEQHEHHQHVLNKLLSC